MDYDLHVAFMQALASRAARGHCEYLLAALAQFGLRLALLLRICRL
jgi:hypothetical protein